MAKGQCVPAHKMPRVDSPPPPLHEPSLLARHPVSGPWCVFRWPLHRRTGVSPDGHGSQRGRATPECPQDQLCSSQWPLPRGSGAHWDKLPVRGRRGHRQPHRCTCHLGLGCPWRRDRGAGQAEPVALGLVTVSPSAQLLSRETPRSNRTEAAKGPEPPGLPRKFRPQPGTLSPAHAGHQPPAPSCPSSLYCSHTG